MSHNNPIKLGKTTLFISYIIGKKLIQFRDAETFLCFSREFSTKISILNSKMNSEKQFAETFLCFARALSTRIGVGKILS